MRKYKHSQFNAGWWSCFCSMAQSNQRLAGMAIYLMDVMHNAGITHEEAEYALDHNTVTDNRMRKVLKTYIDWKAGRSIGADEEVSKSEID